VPNSNPPPTLSEMSYIFNIPLCIEPALHRYIVCAIATIGDNVAVSSSGTREGALRNTYEWLSKDDNATWMRHKLGIIAAASSSVDGDALERLKGAL